jgi:hypothetical protein
MAERAPRRLCLGARVRASLPLVPAGAALCRGCFPVGRMLPWTMARARAGGAAAPRRLGPAPQSAAAGARAAACAPPASRPAGARPRSCLPRGAPCERAGGRAAWAWRPRRACRRIAQNKSRLGVGASGVERLEHAVRLSRVFGAPLVGGAPAPATSVAVVASAAPLGRWPLKPSSRSHTDLLAVAIESSGREKAQLSRNKYHDPGQGPQGARLPPSQQNQTEEAAVDILDRPELISVALGRESLRADAGRGSHAGAGQRHAERWNWRPQPGSEGLQRGRRSALAHS